MIIGVPKEIKNNENRVALTPAGSEALVKAGHTVLIEQSAGTGSGFADSDYAATGARIMSDKAALFAQSDMILKVKEPQRAECELLRAGQILFTYLHLAPDPGLTQALLERKVVGIAYETITGRGGALPLLSPMSEIAGRMSVQIGAHFLESRRGGKGILLGGVSGVAPGRVVVIGGGIVGANAAKTALGLGARVTLLDLSIERLRDLDDVFGGRVDTVMSNSYNIAHWVRQADLLIGAVLVPGAKTPQLVSEAMIASMEPGSVVIDVAIDQGGSIATCDHCTTHDDPIFVKHGVLHYAVANIPGAVSRTATLALTNATLPYARRIADLGWQAACAQDPGLARGVNVAEGAVTFPAVAQAQNRACTAIETLL